MSTTFPRRASITTGVALLTSAGLLTALTALTALPASAATLDGAPAAAEEYFVPASSPAQVRFTTTEGSTTLPAGTYWIRDFAWTTRLPIWVEGLSDQYEVEDTTWSRVVLTAPGPLSFSVPDTGAVGTHHTLYLWAAPDPALDPTTLSDEDALGLLGWSLEPTGDPQDEVDGVVLSATTLRVPATAPDLPPFGPDGSIGDADLADSFGVGTRTWVVRTGNRFVFSGPDGRTLTMAFGRADDRWVTGDWDGDGRESVLLRRGNRFFVDDDFSGGTATTTFTFGRATDEVLVGDFDGDGRDSVAVRRGARVFVSNALTGGVAPIAFTYGLPTDTALVGDWDQNGTDTVSVVRDMRLYVRNSLAGGPAESVHEAIGE